jgi:hypothetical protein
MKYFQRACYRLDTGGMCWKQNVAKVFVCRKTGTYSCAGGLEEPGE